MSEWRHVRLEEVSEFAIGGTPSRNTPEFWAEPPDGHPWLSISDLKGKFVSDTSEHISTLGASASNTKLIPENTTVMSFKLTVGRTAITTRSMYGNEAIAFFRPNDHEVDGRWLYHELPRASKRVVTDTAVKGATLNKKKLASIPLNLPPYREQKLIAQILDTLDTQIRQTEALIAKLETVKQGLLTDLLTRGIDENGQLRPPPEEAPELYKDSPLGRIPVKWEVATIGSVLSGIDAGWSPSCPEDPPREGEWGVLKVSAVSSGVFKPGASKRLPADLRPQESIEVRKNDVLLVRANGVADLVGRCAYVNRTPDRLMLSDKTLRLNPMPEKITSYFLATVMSSRSVRGQIAGLMSGSSGQKNISQKQIESIMVAIPSISEQKMAKRALSDVDERLMAERDEAEKLEVSKGGLMDDLLTGRVRVTPLLGTAKAAQTSRV